MTAARNIRSHSRPRSRPHCRLGQVALLVAACIGLAACASAPKHEKPVDVVNEPPPPRPSSQVLFYPTQGQTPDQQSRDRYECYTWAAKQTGFDPSQAQLAPHQRIEVVPAQKPGSDTATGAITGALLGAAVAGPYDAAAGAFVGAMAGAMMGAASDSSRQHEAARLQRHYDAQDAQHQANVEAQASSYRRAMTACLEGRGYTVK